MAERISIGTDKEEPLTSHIPLAKTTSSAGSELIIDVTEVALIKWFTLIVDNDCYLGIDEDAVITSVELHRNESYTTPRKVRVNKLTIRRKGATNVTLRGSAWT